MHILIGKERYTLTDLDSPPPPVTLIAKREKPVGIALKNAFFSKTPVTVAVDGKRADCIVMSIYSSKSHGTEVSLRQISPFVEA